MVLFLFEGILCRCRAVAAPKRNEEELKLVCGSCKVQEPSAAHRIVLTTPFDIAGNVQVVAKTFETGLQFPQNGADCPTFNC